MSKCTTKSMKFTSRASVKIGDSYFTFESTIEKSVPEDITDEEFKNEKQMLWDEVNSEVDNQIIETQEFLKSKRK